MADNSRAMSSSAPFCAGATLPIAVSPEFAHGHASVPTKVRPIRSKARRGLADAKACGAASCVAKPSVEQVWSSSVTTVMIQNIPNRYTPEELLEEMLQ